MEWLIVENGIVLNVIIATESFAKEIGAFPFYKGAEIGKAYNPPTTEERIATLECQLAQSDEAALILLESQGAIEDAVLALHEKIEKLGGTTA